MSEAKPVGLRIDIETKSGTDISAGTYPYVEDPDFEVLIIGFSPIMEVDGERVLGKVEVLDLDDVHAVTRFQSMLENPRLEKHAFHSQFERVALSRWMGMSVGEYLDPESWYCSMILAASYGVQGSLDEVAKVLRVPVSKDRRGKALIRLFSVPDKKLADKYGADSPLRFHVFGVDADDCHCGKSHREESQEFIDYCVMDVKVEAHIANAFPLIEKSIQKEFVDDQRINDRGIAHDTELSIAAVAAVEAEKGRLMGKLRKLTGVENPNSVQQIRAWLDTQGYTMSSLAKEAREEALADMECPKKVKKMLRFKAAASLSSVAKHQAALKSRSQDGRLRGSLRFYGAHTGREAGRGIQPQNLPRDCAKPEDIALLREGKAGKRAPEIAKGAIRASLVPSAGHKLVVIDYNAIEARVLGWLTGEEWVMDEFINGDGAIYEATAEAMFGVVKAKIIQKIKECGKCSECVYCRLRGSGKVSDLALGYNGGAAALVNMGAEREGIDVGNFIDLYKEFEAAGKPGGKFWAWEPDRHDYPELIRLRDLYREKRPRTVQFWKDCASAWDAASRGETVRFGNNGLLTFMRDGKHNRLVLPSGRSIWYRYAASHEDPDREGRIERRTFIGKSVNVGHARVDTHGGKLTENVTQAVARDVLFDTIRKIEKKTRKGWPGRIILHVHDEVVLEVPEKHAETVRDEVKAIMAKPPKWAKGLPVRGAGDVMDVYGK